MMMDVLLSIPSLPSPPIALTHNVSQSTLIPISAEIPLGEDFIPPCTARVPSVITLTTEVPFKSNRPSQLIPFPAAPILYTAKYPPLIVMFPPHLMPAHELMSTNSGS